MFEWNFQKSFNPLQFFNVLLLTFGIETMAGSNYAQQKIVIGVIIR